MKKCYKVCLVVCLTLLSLVKTIDGAVLSSWDDVRVYRPDPMIFVHGMNSSPEAWGFQIDPATESVTGYAGTSMELRKYFDEYLKQNPITKELLPYIEPFNYQYNTFDAVEWNSYEGYNDSRAQYPDPRIVEIAPKAERPTLHKYQEGGDIPNVSGTQIDIQGILAKYQTTKTNLVAHSLGGVVSRYYINKTQGANVKQLTTLGTPHKGAAVAVVIPPNLSKPVTDPLGTRRIWRIIFIGLFNDIDINREPNMIYELKPSSQFIAELNSSIPSISRYYCIGGIIRVFPLLPILSDTDAFIELESALAAKGALPLELSHDYQPGSILPNYKGKILFPDIVNIAETKHTALPNKWEEILKAIDPAGRVEITEPKDGFTPPDEGELIVKGKVYDEYLPADCKVELKVLLEGELEERVIDNPNPVSGEPAWVWMLSPTDLWRADDPNTPVAEFEIRIPEEYANKTEKVKITVTNAAGYTSEDEVGWNLLIVDEGTKDVYCLDGPMTMRENSPVITNEFRLIDEEGNKIESRPLGVAWDDTLGVFYVSFDDKKIRAYNEYGELVKTNSGRGYLEVPEMPDGLVNPFYNGQGYYFSEEVSKKGVVNYFNERVYLADDVFLYSALWSLVKVNPTDGIWGSDFHWSGLPWYWYSSEEFGLVRVARRGRGAFNLVASDSISLGFSATGLIQRGAYFYFVSSGGRLYQKYCKNSQVLTRIGHSKVGDWEGGITPYYGPLQSYYVNVPDWWGEERGFVRYDISDLPEGFQSVKMPMSIQRFSSILISTPFQWLTSNVYLDVVEGRWGFDEISWSNQPKVLSSLLHLIYPPVYSSWFSSWYEVAVDVTEAVRDKIALGENTLDIRCSVNEEGENLTRGVTIYLGPMYVEETTWAVDLPTDAPSDLGLGGKLRMRIKPGYMTSVNVGDIIQFEAHGKEPLVWQSSDETIGRVNTEGLFTAVGKGTCTVTVQDALGNIATSEVILVQ